MRKSSKFGRLNQYKEGIGHNSDKRFEKSFIKNNASKNFLWWRIKRRKRRDKIVIYKILR